MPHGFPGYGIPLAVALVAFLYSLARQLASDSTDPDAPGLGASLLGTIATAALLAWILLS